MQIVPFRMGNVQIATNACHTQPVASELMQRDRSHSYLLTMRGLPNRIDSLSTPLPGHQTVSLDQESLTFITQLATRIEKSIQSPPSLGSHSLDFASSSFQSLYIGQVTAVAPATTVMDTRTSFNAHAISDSSFTRMKPTLCSRVSSSVYQ